MGVGAVGAAYRDPDGSLIQEGRALSAWRPVAVGGMLGVRRRSQERRQQLEIQRQSAAGDNSRTHLRCHMDRFWHARWVWAQSAGGAVLDSVANLCMRGPTVVCTVGVIVGMTGEPKVKLVVGLTCGGCDRAGGWDCGQADGRKDDGGSGGGMVTEATLVQRLR